MAHVICEHVHCDRLLDSDGCRAADPALEEGANFLAGELLLPTDVARGLCVRWIHEQQVGVMHGISVEMARWRMNVSGGRQIMKRSTR